MAGHTIKLPYLGFCYICGKPITSKELYAQMEDSDSLYCEDCWNEYLSRCETLIEQMRKEKRDQL